MKRMIVNMQNVSVCSSLIHDTICEKWTFEYASKRLTVHLKYGNDLSDAMNVIFEDVYAHHMISCDYWGASPHIYGLEFIDPMSSSLYKQLIDEIRNMGYANSRMSDSSKFIEARIQFISGDILIVLCKHVIIEK